MRAAESLLEENTKLKQENDAVKKENALLRKKIDALTRRLFGSGSSEKLAPEQLQLMLDELNALTKQLGDEPSDNEDEAEALSNKTSEDPLAKPRRASRALPDDIEIVEIHITPDEVEAEPDAFKWIGKEVTEELDIEPMRFLKRLIIRGKYVRIDDKESPPIIAKLPPRLIDKGTLAPGLIAHLIIAKYSDHLPFYRQEKILRERYGVHISRKQMCEMVDKVADWVNPIVQNMRDEFRRRRYLQADEIPIQYIDPDSGKKHTSKGYLWAYGVPGADVIYDWDGGSRSHASVRKFLGSFTGKLQCDGYGAYETLVKTNGDITLVGCMAHVRRKFFEALSESPSEVAAILKDLQSLYRIEHELRQSGAQYDVRLNRRQVDSKPVMDALRKKIEALSGSSLPSLAVGKACDYALGRWQTLTRYLEDGELEIDNNLQENAMRPIALGRKIWLFIGRREAGQRSAIIYTLIESCRRRGIEPYAYLRDILQRRPNTHLADITELTPANWKNSNPAPELTPSKS
jgi:transposase